MMVCICCHRVCVCVCRTVYQIVTDRIVQTPPEQSRPPPSSVGCWTSWNQCGFHGFTVVDVSCQQFILTVFCSLLISRQCVRLTGCRHKTLLNGCLDILCSFARHFSFDSHFSHRGGNYFLPRVVSGEDKSLSAFLIEHVCLLGS